MSAIATHPWTTVQLAEIAQIERDMIPPELIASGTLYVGLENITSAGEFVGVRSVTNGELASTKFRFTRDHILYGKLRPYLAKIARPDFDGVCSTDILPILPGKKVDGRYLRYYLRLPKLIDLAASRTIGANLPRLSPRDLADFEVPLPPLAEQKRIADILDKADAIRRTVRLHQETIESCLESLFRQMFGDVAAKRSPYPIVPLRQYISAANGKSSNGIFSEEQTGIPIYGGNGITGWSTRSLYDEPVIVVGRVGQQCGITRLTQGPAWITDNAIAVAVVDDRVLHLEYLEAALQRSTLGHDVRYIDLPYINQKMILDLPLPLPPLEMQLRYARAKRQCKKLDGTSGQRAEQVGNLFHTLVQRAFRGEL